MEKSKQPMENLSPITIKTRFKGDYICVEDLQRQLDRDKNMVDNPYVEAYISNLILRLHDMKAKGE